jgi:hypothetical protein
VRGCDDRGVGFQCTDVVKVGMLGGREWVGKGNGKDDSSIA